MDHPRSLHLNNSTLWKITLGFLPFYVNFNKRLYDEEGLECARQKEERAMVAVEESDDNYSGTTSDETDVIFRDIKEILTKISATNVPEAEMSDISESSTGEWSDSDTESSESGVTTEGSYETGTRYSGSEWAFACPTKLAGAKHVDCDSLSYSEVSSASASTSESQSISSYYSAFSS